MLKDIANVILNHNTEVKEGTLFVYDITVTIEIAKCIQFLVDNNAIENSNYDVVIGQTTNLELTLARLNSIGYYENVDALIRRNRYIYPSEVFYIKELNQFSDKTTTGFFLQYRTLLEFIDAIKQEAKHTFQDIDVDIAIIFRDDKSLILPFYYVSSDVHNLSQNKIESLEFVANTLKETNSEKKLLFINELIDAHLSLPEESKFGAILNSIVEFKEQCNNAYQYYLRDFSYNKFKIELDSKALEFTQKIQSVINDSQNKLIAIPTAFVLVFATFDFADLYTIKNVASIISLFIFAIIIQIFLDNQYSALNFTQTNIESYKSTFTLTNIEKISEKFKVVDAELKKQKTRLLLVTLILWLIPSILFITWLIMLIVQYELAINSIGTCVMIFLSTFFENLIRMHTLHMYFPLD